MKFFGILFLVVLLIIFLEKPKLIYNIINNIKTVKGLVMNIIYVLPFLMVFFNVESLSEWLSKRSSSDNNYNFNNRQEWWNDPKKRRKFKTKQIRKVSESTKKMVASNQQWKCFMCHNLLDYSYEIDHNVPLFAGGTNHISNLHALCRNCHGKKTIMEKMNLNNEYY
tara:strand:+ start:543 stop:1043 length:501 start_codon:yes stop_codon:yes gene_type:complete